MIDWTLVLSVALGIMFGYAGLFVVGTLVKTLCSIIADHRQGWRSSRVPFEKPWWSARR